MRAEQIDGILAWAADAAGVPDHTIQSATIERDRDGVMQVVVEARIYVPLTEAMHADLNKRIGDIAVRDVLPT